jgi:hypothetical protein
MAARATVDLGPEERREIAAWIAANREDLPVLVRAFLELHEKYLAAGEGDPQRRALAVTMRELRRALRLMPSSEKCRSSGRPLDGLPPDATAKSEREKLEAQIARGDLLSDWHDGLKERHTQRVKRLKERLAKMPEEKKRREVLPLEEYEPTQEERAKRKARAARFTDHLQKGSGRDPAMTPVQETLMPSGAALLYEEQVRLPAGIPEDLADAPVIKTWIEPRVRYDFSVAVTRLELEVEKKIVVDHDGERIVLAPPTTEYGPARYAVTWGALATLAELAGQMALPFNRLGKMLSTPEKKFTAAGLSRMLHYVAQRFVLIYLALAEQLADSNYLGGDDTSVRVLEVLSYFEKVRADPSTGSGHGPAVAQNEKPPWSDYRTPSAAEESLRRCQQAHRARVRRREEGDRTAKRTREEEPTLGMCIGKRFPFESLRKSGDGPKEALHTTVVTGRSVASDPKSLIVFYRSHLGSCGNLIESILESRDSKHRDLVLQGDLSTSNLVTSKDLLSRFNIRPVGCTAHARRPFAIWRDEDPERCEYMLHLFLGLAIHEDQLDVFGRNRENVLAVRGTESREMWNDILELAKDMANVWSKATTLGAAARYLINHFDALTAYLDDPRLEPTNSLRERMLRTEKLIEGSSMFRKTLEGRFVLDVVRTILQTAVAAGIPVHEYMVSVLRTSAAEVKRYPERFTPRAWAAANLDPQPPSAPTS